MRTNCEWFFRWDCKDLGYETAIFDTSDNLGQFSTRLLQRNERFIGLATTDNSVYWGDDGTNIKVLDIRVGKGWKNTHSSEF